MFTLGEIIALAVRIEENGEKAYRQAAQEVQDPGLKAALRWLANEEAEHKSWFLRLKENLDGERKDPKLEEMAQGVLSGVLGDQAFSVAEADFSQLENVRQLLALSIEFEKDTILFYEMLGAFIEDPRVLKELEQIIEEENRHVQTLKERFSPHGPEGK